MSNALIHQRVPPWSGFILYGACALLVQLALLQELALLFADHELFLGFSLASWMTWVGIGSWLARRAPAGSLVWLVPALIPLCLINLVAIRLSKCLLGFGALIGLLPMLSLTVILLAPVGLAIGACFTWGCARGDRPGWSIGAAYRAEVLGAAAGGLLSTFLLAGRLTTDLTIALLAFPGAAVALALIPSRRARLLVGLTILTATVAWMASPIPRWSKTLPWRGYMLVAERTTRYGHLALARTGNLTSLFQNGSLSSSFPDPAAHEELVHWPLLTHQDPRVILVIGGAATGTLAELVKHPVARIDYVELDPAIVEILTPVLAPTDQRALNDPRVRTIHRDGRQWLNHLRDARYDVILLQLPEPRNAQINRLYTLEAFRAANRCLRPSGILAFTIPSSENYLSHETTYFNACLFQTLAEVFPSVELIGGDPLLLMASRAPLTPDIATLTARYRERHIVTRVVTPEYMPIRLHLGRRAALLARLHEAGRLPLNRDLLPVCYAYAWRVWLAKFVSPTYFLGGLLLLAALPLLARAAWRRRRLIRQRPGATALFALGAAGLIYETILLLAFQAIHGAVYWQLGALFAAFMLGLGLGSSLSLKAPRATRGLLAVAGLQGLGLAWLLPRLGTLPPTIPALAPFGLLLIMVAVVPGLAFPLAVRSLPPQPTGQTAGLLYAADLWGAALGAVVASSSLIPLIGIPATAAATGMVLLAAATRP